MAVEPRGPDILNRTAPALSAVSDQPVLPVPAPPLSASGSAADIASGVAAEMSPVDQAAARIARTDPNPIPAPAPTDAVTDPPAADGDQPVAAGAGDTTDQPAGDQPADADVDKNLPGYAQREITKSRNRQRDAEARATAAEAERARLQAERDSLQAERDELAARRAEPQAEPQPNRESFDTPEAYDAALVDWGKREGERVATQRAATERAEADRTAREKAETEARTRAEQEQAQLVATWENKRAAALEKYPDYSEVAESNDVTISMPMAHAIMSEPNGPDIAYHLGKNPEEAARIAAITNPGLQLIEMGKLAARLATPARRPAPLPRPISPIGGNNAPADTTETEPSMEAWAERRTQEIQAERRPFFSSPANAGTRH